ncbi:hypothetical protein M0R45_019698 [Rubus argutus]|uniref:Uncharacterized protein n=1 Tax=Rubus argutus TaxID=59490 RepID=A0AAW1X9S5_RUBAR
MVNHFNSKYQFSGHNHHPSNPQFISKPNQNHHNYHRRRHCRHLLCPTSPDPSNHCTGWSEERKRCEDEARREQIRKKKLAKRKKHAGKKIDKKKDEADGQRERNRKKKD